MKNLLERNKHKGESLEKRLEEIISHIRFDQPMQFKDYYVDAIKLALEEAVAESVTDFSFKIKKPPKKVGKGRCDFI